MHVFLLFIFIYILICGKPFFGKKCFPYPSPKLLILYLMIIKMKGFWGGGSGFAAGENDAAERTLRFTEAAWLLLHGGGAAASRGQRPCFTAKASSPPPLQKLFQSYY